MFHFGLVLVAVALVFAAAYVFSSSFRSAVDQKLIAWGVKQSALDKVNSLVDDLDAHATVKSKAAAAHTKAASAATAEATQASKVSTLLKSA